MLVGQTWCVTTVPWDIRQYGNDLNVENGRTKMIRRTLKYSINDWKI